LRKAAAEAGLELVEIWVESPNEYAASFDAMRALGVEALVIVPTPEPYRDSEALAALSVKAGLPTIGGFRESAQQGFLIGYGPSLRELSQQAANYVERMFNGAHAGELPFQSPTQFDFAINMKTAKALGVAIPPSLLVGAEVID
jgi:putative ABC transport system substrate-binding protein